jgi:signal recognition particle receptor subunit beta
MPHPETSPRVATAASPRDELPTLGGDEEGVALLSAVGAVPATFRELFAHELLLGPEVLSTVRSTLENVEQRLERKELTVVVVGEVRAGKSTLLDAIVGDRLLGGARGELAVVTSLRRCDAPSYRARFASGKEEDFSQRVPDAAAALERAAAELEEQFAAAQRTCRAFRLELGRAEESRGQVETEAEVALGEVEGARELAAKASSGLAGAEDEAARVELSLAPVEAGIPASVRVAPPARSFLAWLWYAIHLLLYRSRHRRYRALVDERERARARLAAEREKATAAAETRALAEARFRPLDLGAERVRLHSSELEQALSQAEAECGRLRSERASLRSEREHLVSERWRRFFEDLKALSKKRDLAEVSIDYPAKLLPDDVTLVDIPGMVSESSPAWDLIRERADGCIMVSELERGVSETAKLFLRQLRDVVPHVILVLTKMDQAYARGVERKKDDPWSQVEHARRIGTRRFARELGRTPDRVLSVSVAAEALLSDRESELAERSGDELDKLFVLLRRERALILGAHAAGAIRQCIAGIADAQAHAEGAYRERILELERQRTPEPAAFRAALLLSAEPAIAAAARSALAAATSVVADDFRVLLGLCEQTIGARASRRMWLERTDELAVELSAGAVAARRAAQRELEASIERGVVAIERELFEALRQRYQLLHAIQRSERSAPRLAPLDVEPPSFAAVALDVRAASARFNGVRWALGASGMVAGAAGGSALHPWIGPVVGAFLGASAALLRRERALRQDAERRVQAALDARREAYATSLAALEPAVTDAIRRALALSLERAMTRFAQFIAEPLELERQALEAERDKLTSLESLRERISEHDRELERLLEAARRASVGLCR